MVRKTLAIAATVVALIVVIQSAWSRVFAWAFLKPVGRITEHMLPVAVIRNPDEDGTFPTAYAISPDGLQTALFYNSRIPHYMFLDSRTGATIGSFTALPPSNTPNAPRVRLVPDPASAYCDHGKFFYGPAFNGGVSFYDAHSLKLLQTFSLDELLLENVRFPFVPKGMDWGESVAFQCANDSPLSVFIFVADEGYQVRVFDLEKMEIVGATTIRQNPLISTPMSDEFGFPDATSLSSDGSLLALQFKVDNQWPPGSRFLIVDVASGRVLHNLDFKAGNRYSYGVTFAGSNALLIGQHLRCEIYDGVCKEGPTNRKLQVWNFGTDGSVVSLGSFEMENYGSFGASADGSRIFSYKGLESWCLHCDWWSGSLRILDARFSVWDRESGKLIYRSPSVPAYHSKCPLIPFSLGGKCRTNSLAPSFSMSADGKAVLAFWPISSQDYAPPEFMGEDEVEVYNLR